MLERFSNVMRLELECAPTAAHAAREALAGVQEIGPLQSDACLVASELVTNAIIRSGDQSDATIEVCARISPRRLLISVEEPTLPVREREPDPEAGLSGASLQIVDTLARQWGVEGSGASLVWAELSRDQAAGGSHSVGRNGGSGPG